MSAALNLKNLLESCEVLGSNTNQRLNVPSQSPVANSSTATTAPSSMVDSGVNGVSNKKDENEDVWSYLEAQAAFLGATPASLWDNGELKVDFMDMEEFFLENGLPMSSNGRSESSPPNGLNTPKRETQATGLGSDFTRASSSSSSSSSCSGGHVYIKPGNLQKHCSSDSALRGNDHEDYDDSSSCESFADTSLQPARPVSTPLAQTPRRKRTVTTAVSDCSPINGNTSDDGSYVPGMDFDPKCRPFSQEELRPQPMSKKSKKQYVPEDLKDDKYWARRCKNNMAAKRSRDARRVKENQIAMRAAFLENEVVTQNAVLKAELCKVNKLYAAALKRLEQFEKPAHKK